MTIDTKAVARWEIGFGGEFNTDPEMTQTDEGDYVTFTDHEQEVGELEEDVAHFKKFYIEAINKLAEVAAGRQEAIAALAASRAEVEGLKLVANHARNLAAWFTSGNSIPVDGVHMMKLSSHTVMDDARQLREALAAMENGNAS